MDIVYQYYNEIVLAFKDYDVDYKEGVITIEVPDSTKPFNSICEKIEAQLQRIAETLEPREKDVVVRVRRVAETKDIVMEKEIQ